MIKSKTFAGQSSGPKAMQPQDNISSYSGTKSLKVNQQEIMIDIHVKHLRMKVDAKTGVRVVWSRGKKQAKTQTKFLTESLDKAVFDEKFQINTIVDIDPVTGIPNKEKMSKMSICLDRNSGGTEIAETDFNMANFKFGEYTITRLHLKQSAGNATIEVDSENTFIEIGLRG